MIAASIPLWLLAAFMFLMGCMAIKKIPTTRCEPARAIILFGIFVICFAAASGFGYVAVLMSVKP